MAFPAAMVKTPRCVEENLAYQFQLLQEHGPQQNSPRKHDVPVFEVAGEVGVGDRIRGASAAVHQRKAILEG